MSGFDVGISFLIGIASLTLTMWVVWRAFHHMPDLAAQLEGIREYVSRKLRVDKAQAALQRALTEHAGIKKLLERGRNLLEDRIVNDVGAMVAAVTFGMVTVVAFLADCALLVLLNGSSVLFGLTFKVWAFLGPWVAAGIFVSLHTLANMAIGDPDRPGITLRRARVGALLSGLIVVFGFWATLSGRGVDFAHSGWAADTIQLGLWLLTLALAVFGAFTSLIATTSFGEARIAKRMLELEGLDEAYTRHIGALREEIKKHSKPAPPAESKATKVEEPVSVPLEQQVSPDQTESDPEQKVPSTPFAFSKAKAIFIAALIGGSLGLTSVAHAQAPVVKSTPAVTGPVAHAQTAVVKSTPAAAGVLSDGVGSATTNQKAPDPFKIPVWLTLPGVAPPDSCEFLFDSSGSMGDSGRLSAAASFAKLLPLAIEAFGCRIVRLSAFSDSPFQKIQEFQVPRPAADQTTSCQPTNGPQGGMSGVARIMYPKLDETLKRSEQDGCAKERKDEEARMARERQIVLADITSAFAKFGSLGPKGTCTAIYQVAARALSRSSRVVAVTDAQQSCGWYQQRDGDALSISVGPTSYLLFLVVQSASDRDGGAAIERAEVARTVFPAASVMLLNEATPAFWQQVNVSRVK